MKVYSGKLIDGGAGGQVIMVKENGREYPLKHIERHSPDGSNWGYGGSGPADTALSILTDCLGEERANELYQHFKWAFVAGWEDEFEITEEVIREWAKEERGFCDPTRK